MLEYQLEQARVEALAATANELAHPLRDSIVPFWIDGAVDSVHRGHLMAYNSEGQATGGTRTSSPSRKHA